MLKIGDVVVTTSHPGPFTIVDIQGDALTIVTAQGLKKVVRAANVRLLGKEKPRHLALYRNLGTKLKSAEIKVW